MEKKTLVVKEHSFNQFKEGLIAKESLIDMLSASWLIAGRSFFLDKEEYYKRELLEGYNTIIFEAEDRTELTKIEFTSTFTYSIEPYDDISVKLVLQSTDSVRK